METFVAILFLAPLVIILWVFCIVAIILAISFVRGD